MKRSPTFHDQILAALPWFPLVVLGLIAPGFGPFAATWPVLVVSFGAMFIVPLALEVLRRQEMPIQVPTMVFMAAWIGMAWSGVMEKHWLPALPWLLVTLWIAWQAAVQMWRGPRTLARMVALSGPVMLAVGGAWYYADRAGLEPLGFDFLIVLLTAAHFHFAGFVLPVAAGLVLRYWPGGILKWAAIGVVAGMPMVATGITLTRMGGRVEVECVLALAFAVCALSIGLAQAVLAWQARTQSAMTRALLFISGASLTAGMLLAILYALRPWVPLPSLHLPRMWAWHGSIQAFGFALCGMMGWLGWHRESDEPPP